jgi:hypothetical protein
VVNRPSWAPDWVDIDNPSPARVYDYLLGGAHNFKADRDLAHLLIKTQPGTVAAAMANRAFLRRSVRMLVESGIRQFLDVGSGIPTVGNSHEIAQSAAPGASVRVVYVDNDEVAVAHSHELLDGVEDVAVVDADIRDMDALMGRASVRRLIDLRQPLGLLFVAVLHFLADVDEPAVIVDRLYDLVAPGSFMVITNASYPRTPTAQDAQVVAQYGALTGVPFVPRSLSEVEKLFGRRWQLLEPVCEVRRWRPDDLDGMSPQEAAGQVPVFGGVATKR